MRIHTKPDNKPYCCKRPTLVPLHYRDQVRADLKERGAREGSGW